MRGGRVDVDAGRTGAIAKAGARIPSGHLAAASGRSTGGEEEACIVLDGAFRQTEHALEHMCSNSVWNDAFRGSTFSSALGCAMSRSVKNIAQIFLAVSLQK